MDEPQDYRTKEISSLCCVSMYIKELLGGGGGKTCSLSYMYSGS